MPVSKEKVLDLCMMNKEELMQIKEGSGFTKGEIATAFAHYYDKDIAKLRESWHKFIFEHNVELLCLCGKSKETLKRQLRKKRSVDSNGIYAFSAKRKHRGYDWSLFTAEELEEAIRRYDDATYVKMRKQLEMEVE